MRTQFNLVMEVPAPDTVPYHIRLLEEARGMYGFVDGTARPLPFFSKEYVSLLREKLRKGVRATFIVPNRSFYNDAFLSGNSNYFQQLLEERDKDRFTYSGLEIFCLKEVKEGIAPGFYFAYSDLFFGYLETPHGEGEGKRTFVLFRDELTAWVLINQLRRDSNSTELLNASEYTKLKNIRTQPQKPTPTQTPQESLDDALYEIWNQNRGEVLETFNSVAHDKTYVHSPAQKQWLKLTKGDVRGLKQEMLKEGHRFCLVGQDLSPHFSNSLIELWMDYAGNEESARYNITFSSPKKP